MSWEQILEFRQDRGASRKYRNIRLWLRDGLHAETITEASELVEKKIEDYEWAIRKHGLKYSQSVHLIAPAENPSCGILKSRKKIASKTSR